MRPKTFQPHQHFLQRRISDLDFSPSRYASRPNNYPFMEALSSNLVWVIKYSFKQSLCNIPAIHPYPRFRVPIHCWQSTGSRILLTSGILSHLKYHPMQAVPLLSGSRAAGQLWGGKGSWRASYLVDSWSMLRFPILIFSYYFST